MTTLSPHSAAKLQDLLKTKEPKKVTQGWRNKFWSELPCVFRGGGTQGPGEWFAVNIHLTQQLAELIAKSDMERFRGWIEQNGVEYLGAFPIE